MSPFMCLHTLRRSSHISQPFLFYSAFQDKVDFTANTELFRRQIAAFVEYIFQQTTYLAFQALGAVWRQVIHQTCLPSSAEEKASEENILETNPACCLTWAPRPLAGCVKYVSKQRSWTTPWWNIPFCSYFSIQPMP